MTFSNLNHCYGLDIIGNKIKSDIFNYFYCDNAKLSLCMLY